VTHVQHRQQEPAAKPAGGSWRTAALIGIPAGVAISAAVLGLGDHFMHTGNRIGIAAILGGFVLLMLVSDLTGARGSRLREAGNSLAALAVIAVALGGLLWIVFRHWPAPATYAAGIGYEALLALAWYGLHLVRNRLYSRKARRARARTEAYWRARLQDGELQDGEWR
jgi:apolipoprotein N-acyltransferase